MRKKTFYTKLLALVMVALMIAVSFVAKTPSNATEPPELDAYTPQQIIGNYGLTALDNIYINAHCHSNFLVKVLNNNANSGLNSSATYSPHNADEQFYFETFGSVNNDQLSNGEDMGYLYVGPNVKLGADIASNRIQIVNDDGKSAYISKPKYSTNPEENRIFFGVNYVDMDVLTAKMVNYNKAIKDIGNIGIVNKNFSDQNNRIITVEGDNLHALEIEISEMEVPQPTKIFFKGVDENNTTASIVINIDLNGKETVSIGRQLLAYSDDISLNNKEVSAVSNHNRIYYNFYDSSNEAGNYQYTGTINFDLGFGTIIAPSATVNLSQNWDGVVVAKDITIASEFHRIVGTINPPNPTSDDETVEKTATGTFAKKDKANEKQLKGAVLKLTINSNNNDLSKVTIDGVTPTLIDVNKKSIQWSTGDTANEIAGLPEGEYVWSEVSAPADYEKSPDIRFKVTADGKIHEYLGNDGYSQKGTTALTMYDTCSAQVIFSKQSVWGREVKGATLVLHSSSKQLDGVHKVSKTKTFEAKGLDIRWVSEDTPTIIGNLPNDTYTFREENAPDGYEKFTAVITFEIKDGKVINVSTNGKHEKDGSSSIDKIIMVDECITTNGTFSKVDEEGNALSGAELSLTIISDDFDLSYINKESGPEITKSNNNNTIKWTSTGAPLVISGLPVGTYMWEEMSAPGGFKISKTITFKVDKNKNIYEKDGDDWKIIGGDNKLKMVDERDTTEDGETVTRKFSKVSSVDNGELTGAELSLTITTAGKDLSKVDRVSGPEIKKWANWSNDRKTITWISTNEPMELRGLPVGEYKWHEVSAPAGYKTSSDVEFKVDADGKIYEKNGNVWKVLEDGKMLTMIDYAKPTAIGKFSKVSSVNKGEELPGAKLSLTLKTGNSDLSRVKRVSGPEIESRTAKKITWVSTSVSMELSGLPEGIYEWEETAPPKGYDYASMVTFKVDENGKIYKQVGSGWEPLAADDKLTMVDEALKDPNTSETESEEPTTQKPSESEPEEPTTTEASTTQEDKTTATITEKPTTEKPTTQKPTTEKPTTQKPTTGKPTTEKDKTDEESTTEPKKDVGSLQIIVYDEKTGDVVPKATVQVTYPNKKVKEFKTNKKGEITIKNLPPGKYKSETIKVPDGYTVSAGKVYKSNVVAGGTTVCEVFIVTHKNDVDGGNSDVDSSNDNTSDNSMTDDSNKVDNSDTISDNTNNITTGDRFPLQQIIILMGVTLFGIIVLLIVKTGER